MNKIISFTLLAGLALLGWQQAAEIDSNNRQAQMDYVYTVCNESRISVTIKEGHCGDVQDATHTEFLCKEANTSPLNHCWVEDKE